MRFLDVKTDFAFKKVFGSQESENILISFLNSVLEFGHARQITALTIVDPYNIPMLKGMKDTYVDVKAKLNDGTLVIIEMQVLSCQGFEQRVLYNAAKNYSLQLQPGDDYTLLNPVIALTLTDFVMFADDSLRHCFKLLEKDFFIEYSDDIELVFIELPKFIKTLEQLETEQDKWLFFIKNAGRLEAVPGNLDVELQRAFQIVNEANMTQAELELQHRKHDWIAVQRGAYNLALQQGLEKGIQQGLEEGIQKGLEEGIQQGIDHAKHEIILRGYQAGLTFSVLATLSGLSETEIAAMIQTQTEFPHHNSP